MVTSRRRAFVMKADPDCAEAALMQQLDRRAAIMHWRKAERARLIAQRLSISTGDRADGADLIAASLDAHLPDLTCRTISVYGRFAASPI